MTPEEESEFKRTRKARNLVLMLMLLGFVGLLYAITIVRIGD